MLSKRRSFKAMVYRGLGGHCEYMTLISPALELQDFCNVPMRDSEFVRAVLAGVPIYYYTTINPNIDKIYCLKIANFQDAR